MQEAEYIDRAQKANSEQAVEPRYLVWRTNPAAPQVETVAVITIAILNSKSVMELKAACEEITTKWTFFKYNKK